MLWEITCLAILIENSLSMPNVANWEDYPLRISDLKVGMKQVTVSGKVIEKSSTREVLSRWTTNVHRVANAIIADDSGKIKLVLWNNQIDEVSVNDAVKIENGYVSSFRGEAQLNVGRNGKLTIMK